MAVSEDKIRRSVTFEKELYKLIQEISRSENTTVSKLINKLIEMEYIQDGKTN